MEEKKVKRSKFSSNLGMMLACIGGAVGLGNVWGFPSKLGRGGGFYFLIIYVVVALLLGIPMTLSEYAIGRKMRKGPIAAWTELNRKWKFVGILNAIVCVGVMGFYCLLFGWIIKYMVEFGIAIFNPASTFWTMDSAEYFSMFISNPVEPLIWTFVGLLLAYLCVRKNMAGGIEKACKWMIPALVVLLIVVAIRACTLPGAEAGIEFLFQPSTENVMTSGGWLTVFGIALAQMFFSLNVGFGTNLMYGSYAPDDSDLAKNALLVPLGDMVVALLAALATIPAAFAFGYSPSTGAGMLFITMKAVFESMPGGAIFGFLFFVAVFFAAISSVIGMTAANAAIPCEHWGWSNKKGTLLALASNLIIAIPVSLGYSSLSGVRLLSWMGKDTDILDSIDYLCENCFATVAALALCIFVGWIWKPAAVIEEVEKGGKFKFTWKGIFTFLIRYICPIITLIVVLSSIGIISL